MSIASHALLLADTGPLCRFAEAGDEQVDALVDYLGEALRITQDVNIEVQRLAKTKFPRLHRLAWKGFPSSDPITITDKRLLDQIENIVQGRRRHSPGHFMEDRGEVATILVAKAIECSVLIDDRWGKDTFAVRKGVPTFSTEDLAVEMASAGALTEDEAYAVFRRVYRSSRSSFDTRLGALRQARA
jgi:hypothetical protein